MIGTEWYCVLLEDGRTTPWCMSRVWIDHPCYSSVMLDARRVAVIRCRAKPYPEHETGPLAAVVTVRPKETTIVE
jgi:hypothetical protein